MTDNYAALLRQTARVYRESLAAPDTDDIFSLAYQWQDKKHRHVHDLCNELEQTADRIEKLEAALREIREMHYEGGVDDLEERDDRTYCIVCDALEGEDE